MAVHKEGMKQIEANKCDRRPCWLGPWKSTSKLFLTSFSIRKLGCFKIFENLIPFAVGSGFHDKPALHQAPEQNLCCVQLSDSANFYFNANIIVCLGHSVSEKVYLQLRACPPVIPSHFHAGVTLLNISCLL